jgi:hypothetical protein
MPTFLNRQNLMPYGAITAPPPEGDYLTDILAAMGTLGEMPQFSTSEQEAATKEFVSGQSKLGQDIGAAYGQYEKDVAPKKGWRGTVQNKVLPALESLAAIIDLSSGNRERRASAPEKFAYLQGARRERRAESREEAKQKLAAHLDQLKTAGAISTQNYQALSDMLSGKQATSRALLSTGGDVAGAKAEKEGRAMNLKQQLELEDKKLQNALELENFRQEGSQENPETIMAGLRMEVYKETRNAYKTALEQAQTPKDREAIEDQIQAITDMTMTYILTGQKQKPIPPPMPIGMNVPENFPIESVLPPTEEKQSVTWKPWSSLSPEEQAQMHPNEKRRRRELEDIYNFISGVFTPGETPDRRPGYINRRLGTGGRPTAVQGVGQIF